jgi:hypothetical protein
MIYEPTEGLRHIIGPREVTFAAVSLQDKTRGALREVAVSIRDFRLPPRCKRDLRAFGGFRQRKVVVPYRRFGKHTGHVKMGPIGFPETYITN